MKYCNFWLFGIWHFLIKNPFGEKYDFTEKTVAETTIPILTSKDNYCALFTPFSKNSFNLICIKYFHPPMQLSLVNSGISSGKLLTTILVSFNVVALSFSS